MENQRDLRKLADTALGKRPADLVVKNGVLMDVYTGRMVPGRSVSMVDEWIAYVGPDAEYTIGPETEVIDAGGRIMCPGFIDAHTHLINFFNINDFLTYAIPCGVTTLLTETESYGFAIGAEGVKAFLKQIDSCPIKIYTLIPPMISLSPASESLMIRTEQLTELFKDPRVIGLGEPFWQGAILTRDQRVLDLWFRAGWRAGSHTSGAPPGPSGGVACGAPRASSAQVHHARFNARSRQDNLCGPTFPRDDHGKGGVSRAMPCIGPSMMARL